MNEPFMALYFLTHSLIHARFIDFHFVDNFLLCHWFPYRRPCFFCSAARLIGIQGRSLPRSHSADYTCGCLFVYLSVSVRLSPSIPVFLNKNRKKRENKNTLETESYRLKPTWEGYRRTTKASALVGKRIKSASLTQVVMLRLISPIGGERGLILNSLYLPPWWGCVSNYKHGCVF